MDVLGWLWWGLAKLLGAVWSIGWFLMGGWVVTLAQLVIIAGLIYGYKYGWRRGPLEMARHVKGFGSFAWAWMRTRDVSAARAHAASHPGNDRARSERSRHARRQFGDVNVSTLLSLVALFGLGVVALA